jgi:hypothetical protein
MNAIVGQLDRPAPAMSPEEAQKHNRILLHALQTAHPVLYRGTHRFIHTLTFQVFGGGIHSTVYLTGDPSPIEPAQVQLQEQPT